MTPTILSWSGGKDSALALHRLQQQGQWKIASLLTVAIAETQCVSMHEIPLSIIKEQARQLDLPLRVVTIPRWPSNVVYESAMEAVLRDFAAEGIRTIAFGDLFLDEIRDYRERFCQRAGWEVLFPLWNSATGPLSQEFLAEGFLAKVCCIDQRKLTADFVGRDYDTQFLNDLPGDIDPCGERGEFHTVVWDGPQFRESIPLRAESVTRAGDFWYTSFQIDVSAGRRASMGENVNG